MDTISAALMFKSLGYKPIPCKDKIPMVKGWRDNDIPITSFIFPEIAIQTGINGLEVIDIDNKLEYTETILKRLSVYPSVISRTRSGGYHLIYRTDTPAGNMKLARNENGITIVETRGVGGIIIAAPTAGYIIIRGSFDEVPYLSQRVRTELIELACSFNRHAPANHTVKHSDEDEEQDYAGAFRALLAAGWVEVGSGRLRRPGKSFGSSATWGFTPPPYVFYVFSSNAYPFDPFRAYCPAQIIRLLNGI